MFIEPMKLEHDSTTENFTIDYGTCSIGHIPRRRTKPQFLKSTRVKRR